MKRSWIQAFAVGMALLMLGASCSSTTMIQSRPTGATVFLDNQRMGTTPYTHRDTKTSGSCMNVLLELEGYEPFFTVICRNEQADPGAIVGGIFFLFPFIWTMGYYPVHEYELTPIGELQEEPIPSEPASNGITPSSAEQLRELKRLLDEGVLTQEEFEKEKAKVLEKP